MNRKAADYLRQIGRLSPSSIAAAYLVSSLCWVLLANFVFNRLFAESPWLRTEASLVLELLGVLFMGAVVYLLSARLEAKHVASEKLIREQAARDGLTGLYNRQAFDDLLSHAIAHAQRHDEGLALMFLDLDNFKKVNDTYGHIAADNLLRELARRLNDCCARYGDDLVARMGGDEFALIQRAPKLPNGPRIVAERVLAAVSTPYQEGGERLSVTASIGISLYPDDGQDPEQLLRRADLALYQAKAQGRATFCFYGGDWQAKADEILQLELALRHALEGDELFLVYQPKLDTSSMKVVGVEALVRWHHPEMGDLSAQSFVPLAEKTGLIWPLTKWVLRAACRQASLWYCEEGLDVNVAVNLSPSVFAHEDLEAVIEQVLHETALPPDRLTLEITEQSLMLYDEESLEVLQRLRAMGMSIQIDDFGTGYSSLASLKHYHFQALKIDRSFIDDVVTSSDDAAIATTIMFMSKCLDMEAIAEGVESEAQKEFLRSIDCRLMQGFYFARPLSAKAATRFISRFNRPSRARGPLLEERS